MFWSVRYEANELPNVATPAWTKGGSNYTEAINNSILELSANASGFIIYEQADENISNNGLTIEARIRVITATEDEHCEIELQPVGLSPCSSKLTLLEDKIRILDVDNTVLDTYDIDTTDDFHIYRITLKNSVVKVYVNGVLRMEATLVGAHDPFVGKIFFGAAWGSTEHYWDYVYYRTDGAFEPEIEAKGKGFIQDDNKGIASPFSEGGITKDPSRKLFDV